MFDRVGLRIEDFPMESYNQSIERMGIERPKDSEQMFCMWHNMMVKYYPNKQRLIIINSMHKLYNAIFNGFESNHDDFHIDNLIALFSHLEKVLGRTLQEMHLYSVLEIGLNINTNEIKPFKIIEKWESLDNPFEVLSPSKGKPAQKTCHFSDYKIKGYDKGIESSIVGKNILRYEIVLQQLRKIRTVLELEKNQEITLATLIEHETWVKLYRYLIGTYKAIRKQPFLSGAIPLADLQAIYSYIHYPYREDIKRSMNINTYWKLMKQYKSVYEHYIQLEGNIHNVIQKKMEVKFMELCNDPVQDFQYSY